MFGLFKRSGPMRVPDEPIELKVAIEIERSVDDVYALLDFGDDRHQLRARGNEIRQIGRDPLEYRLWYDLAPDHNFLFTVTQAVPGRAYAYAAAIFPAIGWRVGSHEAYSIDPLAEQSCKLTFVNTIHHAPGMTTEQLQIEIANSTLAAARSLTKLKIQAELGVDAVEEFEREQGQR